MTSTLIHVGISQAFHNKQLLRGYKKAAFGNSFLPQQISLDALKQHIVSGGAFTMGAFKSEQRIKDNFMSSQMVALDLDDNVSVSECQSNAFINQYAAFIGATASSGKQDDYGQVIYKTRVLFMLDEPITDRQAWERLQRALLWHFEGLHPDAGCKDCTRLFYGSDNPDYIFDVSKVLPIAVLQNIAEQMDNSGIVSQEDRTPEDNSRILIRNKSNRNNDRVMTAAQRYADVTLDNMASELSSMSEGGGRYGGRNNTLYRFGAAIGNMVASGMVSRSQAESTLYSAALSCGMAQREISATLHRAISDGETTPFDLSRFENRSKPERPEPIVLEDYRPQDERSYAQIIADEIMARDIAYQNQQFVSWYPQDDLPISWVSALLNLASARSSMPAVVVKMHHALRTGKLKSYFSIQDVVNATGYSTRLITKTLETLEKMTFIHFLRTVSLDTLPHSESVQKGRPSQIWAIESDSAVLRSCLQNMLEKKSRVRVVRRALSKRDGDMALQLGLDDDEFIAFKERGETAQHESLNAEADRAYMREMFGNGHEWKGWQRALSIDYGIQLDVDSFENCKELRGQVALWWIEHVRDVNSREDWQRILGCSDGTIDSIFDSVNIKTIQQNEKLELKAPSTLKAMETLYIQSQRDYRGKIWKISYKLNNEEGWQVSSEFTYKRDFLQNRGNIEKVFMILTTPSKQVLMDEAEIAAIEAEREAEASTPDNVIAPDFTQDTDSDDSDTETSEKPRRITVPSSEHVYTTFPYKWLFRQVQLDVHCFTDYTLSNDGTVLDKDKQLVRRRSDLGDLVRWINQVASDSQLRTTASFYGEDYTDEDEMKELLAIERIHIFEENYQAYVIPATVNRYTVAILAKLSAAGALNAQVTLDKATPEPYEASEENPYARDVIEYAKPSARAIAQMIAHPTIGRAARTA